MSKTIHNFLKRIKEATIPSEPTPKSSVDVIIDYLKTTTTAGIIPSEKLSSDEYAIFLELASAYELETDTIYHTTYKRVRTEAGTLPQKPEPPPGRIIY
jgi:hypothetical protein